MENKKVKKKQREGEREWDEWRLLWSYNNIFVCVALRGNTCCNHTYRHPTMMLSFCSLTPIVPSLLLPVLPEYVLIFFLSFPVGVNVREIVCKSESVCILHHMTHSVVRVIAWWPWKSGHDDIDWKALRGSWLTSMQIILFAKQRRLVNANSV